ncbi:uncharacterized protein PFL1_01249 [Pseudozyma flocculosa PF-1]|uniref:Zn(2)-C6 fungal-type domain-containing protein n=1 Tax=Pseudozyma flocculosa TaxID=84751 RepID=A0A5C3EXL1_9BASI|nr:uncharacterized protein PFL1_01249 [Pseudozyma flocculosa PF-1]EPQ31060.1 hypothetical protein PFL1_01249 [Pseudozyma flocculosa PF-1]SPO35909.1 uncharacterized protein PSFLO_01380 [Pseudozyma flocculosa]
MDVPRPVAASPESGHQHLYHHQAHHDSRSPPAPTPPPSRAPPTTTTTTTTTQQQRQQPHSTSPSAHPFLLPYKRSQRPSWSCTECARRKIKCDKQIPCASCIKRGCPERCHLEGSAPVVAAGPQTPQARPPHSTPKAEPFGPSPLASSSAATSTPLAQHASGSYHDSIVHTDGEASGSVRRRKPSRTSSDATSAAGAASDRRGGLVKSAAAASTAWHGSPPDPYFAPRADADPRSPSPSHALPSAGPLERIRKQLDRIEARLGALEARDASAGDLHARIQDVEEVISLLGERRSSWERSRAQLPLDRSTGDGEALHYGNRSPSQRRPGAGIPTSDRESSPPNSRRASRIGAASSDGVHLDGSRGPLQSYDDEADRHGLDHAHVRSPGSAAQRRLSDEEVEAWRENRNAELAAEDAATALEFFALGKDRRHGIIATGAEAEVQVGSDGEPSPELAMAPRQAQSAHDDGMADEMRPRTSPSAHRDVQDEGRDAASTDRLDRLRLRLPYAVDLSEPLQIRLDAVFRRLGGGLLPSNIAAHPTTRTLPDSMASFALSPASIRAIVKMARDIGAWQHCCVHFPTFEREVDAFLDIVLDDSGDDHESQGGKVAELAKEAWSVIDPAWLSLFFVVCSIAIHQMSADECRECGVESGERQGQLASTLLNMGMEALSLAEYLVRPSVYCCQTIAILCVAGHNICGSDLLTSLLAIGIKTGQTLNLHALGRPARILEESMAKRSRLLARERQDGPHGSDGDTRNAGECARGASCRVKGESERHFAAWKKRIVDLEVGKRVWWAFTQQDYFAIPYRGCFSIFEGQYDTPLPHNCSDEDLEHGKLVNRDVSELTVASKQRYTCHVAKIVCDFFQDLNRSQGTVDFSLVQHHERRLREVTDKFTTSCLRTSRPYYGDESPLPAYATVMQHYLFISVHHKIIVMHRAFLSRRISAADRQLSHDASIETARAILQQLERGLGMGPSEGDRLDLRSSAHGGALWTIPYHAVAAATILALDMLRACKTSCEAHNDEGAAEERKRARRDEVKRALHALSSFTAKSAIAQRGCQLLIGLLDEAKRWDDKRGREGKRKGPDRPADGEAEEGRAAGTPNKRAKGNVSDGVAGTESHLRAPFLPFSPTNNANGNHPGSLSSHDDRRTARGQLPWPQQARRQRRSTTADAGPSTVAARFGQSYGFGSSGLNPLAGDATSHNSFLKGLSPFPSTMQNEYTDLFNSRSIDGAAEPFAFYGGSSIANGPDLLDASPSSVATTTAMSPHQLFSNGGDPSARRGIEASAGALDTGLRPVAAQPGQPSEHGAPHLGPHEPPGSHGTRPLQPTAMMDFGMVSEQQLSQILPALESMPDVWRLFDGTLGSNLVEFQENGF